MASEAKYRRKMLTNPNYNPNAFLDYLCTVTGADNDKELCEILDVHQATISKTRNKRQGISSDLLIKIHDATGLSIKQIKTRLNIV